MRLGLWVVLLLGVLAGEASGQARRFRVAVGGIMHESNSFFPSKTTMADYRIEDPGRDPEVMARWARSSSELSGYIEGAKQANLDLYPIFLANATPKGPLTDETYTTLVTQFIGRLKAAPKLDGLLLALHGAMVTDSIPQADEETVRRIRKVMGPDFPIIVTHDFHANVSPELVRLSTVLITYKQCPHLDTRDRGLQAATIMGRILRGEVKPVQRVVKPPMIYNIAFQNTYAEPLLPIVKESMRLERENPKILAVSVPGGYQWGDVPYMGPSAIVVTDNDPELAQKEAQRLSDMLWATRERIKLQLPDAAEAVRQAMREPKSPVALMDMGDNIGGGSAGDSTFLLEELLKQKADGWVVVIRDVEAVKAAVKAGIGGGFDMAVGGKTDDLHGKPVRVRGRVKSLHDGKYIETAIRHGGARYHDMGLTAVIAAEGSTLDMPSLLVLTTERSSPNSLNQLISCGIYPERMKILTPKGSIAPRAAYEPVAAKIILVDTLGPVQVNPKRYTYKKVREHLWGMD